MDTLYVLQRGRVGTNGHTVIEGSRYVKIIQAFRSKAELINYVKGYIDEHVQQLSKDGYLRFPSDDEFVSGNEIRFARDQCGAIEYFKFETCKL
jgi:hypothetical protein